MQFSNEILIRVAMVVLGLCGFLVARHIHNHKTKDTPLVCMVGFDCQAVVHSDYSKFLGIPVEILGMIYYALITVAYLLFICVPNFLSFTYIPVLDVPIMFCIALSSFLFSAYLIVVQAFIIKKGCSWCIISALISALIFVLTVIK